MWRDAWRRLMSTPSKHLVLAAERVLKRVKNSELKCSPPRQRWSSSDCWWGQGGTLCGNPGTEVLRGAKSAITQLLTSEGGQNERGQSKERVSEVAEGGPLSGAAEWSGERVQGRRERKSGRAACDGALSTWHGHKSGTLKTYMDCTALYSRHALLPSCAPVVAQTRLWAVTVWGGSQ